MAYIEGTMKLDRLFQKSDWTEELLATAVGVDQSTINRLRTGDRNAGLGLAVRIERATKGMVTAAELPMTKDARRDLLSVQSHATPLDVAPQGDAA